MTDERTRTSPVKSNYFSAVTILRIIFDTFYL